MSFDVLNPWMLAGLAGISLPVIAHLLNKRKYDVVQWGAMQFLELGRETRRRVRLEEFLLLLIRILIIALIVLALSRPWASGGIFTNLVSSQPRDVVIIVDGSFSMGREDGIQTPHQKAIDWAEDFLGELTASDAVALLDARDQVRSVIDIPTHDIDWVRDELRNLPPPSGTSNLAEACTRAVQILSRTTNLSREILVVTDGQAHPWATGDTHRWIRFEDLLEQPAVRPRVWVVDVGTPGAGDQVNFTVGPVRLSRDLTVTDFPVRITTTVRYSGGATPVNKRVDLEIDGRKIADRSLLVQLQPGGEATVEFEHRFNSVGSYVVGVSVEGDPLPGDNRSLAAISVEEAVPVLLVSGSREFDPTRQETFFAQAALSPAGQQTPWVKAETVPLAQWQPDDLSQYAAVILANVPTLDAPQREALETFVADGGGVLFALGDLCRPDDYNTDLFQNGEGLFPALLRRVVADDRGNDATQAGIRVADDSLELPWLRRFRADANATLPDVRFDHWWTIDLPNTDDRDEDPLTSSAPVAAARLNNGTPWLIVSDYERGRVMVLTTPLDADWSTLPAKPDYVPLLHEIVFQLASASVRRNVAPGSPLLMPVEPDFDASKYAFYDPRGEEHAVDVVGTKQRPLARFADTLLPGVYSLERKPRDSDPLQREYFVVDFDRSESDLVPLDDSDIEFLSGKDRMAFVDTLDELQAGMLTDTSRAELWPWFLFGFLGLLVFEVWMTRRLVQGGHVAEELLARNELPTSDAFEEQIEDFEEFEDYEPFSAAGASQNRRTVRDSRDL